MLTVSSDYGNRICRDEARKFVDPKNAGVGDRGHFWILERLYAVRLPFDRCSLQR